MTSIPIPAALAATLVLVAHSALADEAVVNVYNWYDYIGTTTVADFEAETGIAVRYDTFDSNEILEAKLMTGGSGYDVTVPASNFLARQVAAGVFLPLDRSLLPHYGNLDPELLARLGDSDPGNLYAVPYTWGTTGIAYNVGNVAARLGAQAADTFALIFDPETAAKLADCGIAIVDSPAEVTAAALAYLGRDPNSETDEDLAAAMDVLDAIRPYVRHFKSGQIINDLASGEICVALAYSGDAAIAAVRAEEAGGDVEVAFAIPREGAQVFFDVLAIPVDAPHPEAAHAFVDYMLRPEVIAGVTNTVFFANANAAAGDFVDPAVLADASIYPPQAVRERLFAVKPHDIRYDRKLTRAWTSFRTGM